MTVMLTDLPDFAPVIARCLAGDDAPEDLIDLVRAVLLAPDYPTAGDVAQLAERIAATPDAGNQLDLVYGGATRIKGYIFESPNLPEIRGASALLDWVNDVALPQLWGATDRADFVAHGIVYAGGGSILGFTPVGAGAARARAIEAIYTTSTLTAQSVAVSMPVSLLELRYGRAPTRYWVEQFLADWGEPQLQPTLAAYYYLPDPAPTDVADGTISAERWRFFNRKQFGELVTLLAGAADRRRAEAVGGERAQATYGLSPWLARCDSSDVRPAVYRGTIGDETAPREISEATARKRYVGQLLKVAPREQERATRWFRDAFGPWEAVAGIAGRSWERAWVQYLRTHDTAYGAAITRMAITDWEQTIRPAEDVGAISQASDPRRYVGMIYADGDNVGRLIATLKTPSAYALTSSQLRNAATQAVFAALAAHLEPVAIREQGKPARWVHPFEILTIGGDDLLVIVPGSLALPIAISIGATFERVLADPDQIPRPPHARSSTDATGRYARATPLSAPAYTPAIGLSAGVVIAQENAPIFFLRDLVEELQKRAKKLAKANAQSGFYGGAVDFMVLKSVTMVSDSIELYRRAALGDVDAADSRRRTARPYRWHELAGLLATVRALKGARMPRSQLYRMRRTLDTAEHGVQASVLEYFYTRARLRKPLSDMLITALEQPWYLSPHFAGQRVAMPPWMPRGDRQAWETIWPDLVEVYDMVAEEGA